MHWGHHRVSWPFGLKFWEQREIFSCCPGIAGMRLDRHKKGKGGDISFSHLGTMTVFYDLLMVRWGIIPNCGIRCWVGSKWPVHGLSYIC